MPNRSPAVVGLPLAALLALTSAGATPPAVSAPGPGPADAAPATSATSTVPTAAEQRRERARAFVRSLQFQEGVVRIPEARARIRLGADFRFLPRAEARRVVEQLWGNPPQPELLGLVVPRESTLEDATSWAVAITFEDSGHVDDAGAASIDYARLLADMQAATEAENAERRRAGFGAVRLVGWAVPPHYDAAERKLHWAQELAFEGTPGHTLNSEVRVLGRSGVLSLTAAARMLQMDRVRRGMDVLLPRVEFEPGARYIDFDPATDARAAHGIAQLVGGEAAGPAAPAARPARRLVPWIGGAALLLLALLLWRRRAAG